MSSPRLLYGRAASYGSLIVPGEVIAKGRCRLLIYAAVSLAVQSLRAAPGAVGFAKDVSYELYAAAAAIKSFSSFLSKFSMKFRFR